MNTKFSYVIDGPWEEITMPELIKLIAKIRSSNKNSSLPKAEPKELFYISDNAVIRVNL